MKRAIALPSIALLALAFSFLLFAFPTSAYAQQGPFSNLSGTWSGAGTISLGNGSKERIKCRATYIAGGDGNNLKQTLRCASDSYRFDLNSDVVSQMGSVSGTWSESSRNIGGALSGSVRSGSVQVIVTSPSFSANLSLTTQGDRQSVVVSAPPGGQLAGVSITLSRSR